MKRDFRTLALLLPLACANPGEPSSLYPTYFLSKVDGQLVPVPFGGDGSVLLAGGLGFGGADRPRPQQGLGGTVNYMTQIRRPDQSIQHSTVDLNYAINDGVLHIDLCPPLAQCLVSSELVGPIVGRTSALVLTHYLAGNPGSVYRFFPSLPD